MSSTSSTPQVSSLQDPYQSPSAVGTTTGTTSPPQSAGRQDPSQPLSAVGTAPGPTPLSQSTGPELPQRSEAQDIPTQQGNNAFNSERPLDVRPAPEGGVATGGQCNLPQGQPSLSDKIIGKTEKVIGKAMNNEERHERGELRETGGKAAAEGRARAAHD